MKPYLIFSKTRYAPRWDMEEFATREEAADRAAGKEDGETIIAARLLNLRVSLGEAPEWVEPAFAYPVPVSPPATIDEPVEAAKTTEEPF